MSMLATSFPPQAAIVANGDIGSKRLASNRIEAYSYIVAVDGGSNTCYHMEITPQLIIGDMDSISQDAKKKFNQIPKIEFPAEKDETDLELALNYLFSHGTQNATIFGGLGKRIDHTLGNIVLLTRFPGKAFLESDSEKLVVVDRDLELSCYPGQTISLIPLNGPVTGIKTTGLKWELNNGKLDKMFMGISNVALSERITIHVESGDLLCVINLRDPS